MQCPEDLLSESEAESPQYVRIRRYWRAAAEKKYSEIGNKDQAIYYDSLVKASLNRSDLASKKDRHQINKDLGRTFKDLIPGQSEDVADLLPMLETLLERILRAYIERGRSMSAKRKKQMHNRFGRQSATPTQLHSRGLLTGYPQGLNFLAGMGMLAAGGAIRNICKDNLEHSSFWLLALLLEDVLDPDFFGADVKDNLQMAYIGGLGLKSLVLQHAETCCPILFGALGHEAFQCTLSMVLDQWVLSLFVSCMPIRLLEKLWDQLLLHAPQSTGVSDRIHKACPQGLAYIVAFTLAVLQCCGDEMLAGTQILEKVQRLNLANATIDEISLEAGDAMKKIRESLLTWPAEQDDHLLSSATKIREDFIEAEWDDEALWEDVRVQKQEIANCAGKLDDQLMALAQRTHFSQGEIHRSRDEFERISGSTGGKVDLKTFEEVVSRSVPDFPPDLCGRLFDKLDVFCVGHLSFVELVCGMSALSLGTMDEKLQVCFDLFDSEDPPGTLTTKDLGDLCAVLFRVALAQGFLGARKASRHEDIDSFETASTDSGPDDDLSGKDGTSKTRSNSNPPDKLRAKSLCLPASHSLPQSRSLIEYMEADAASKDDHIKNETVTDGIQAPWRSMFLRLLAAAHVRTDGGPRVVTFEDFRIAANMEPALLCLFKWCLPRPPALSETDFVISPVPSVVGSDFTADVPQEAERCTHRWKCLLFWRRNRQEMSPSLLDDGVSLPSTTASYSNRHRVPLPVVTRGLPQASGR